MLAGPRRELIAGGSQPSDGRWITEGLEPRFGVHKETSHPVRSIWLDSVDSRLLRAGLVLRQDSHDGRRTLVLEKVDGSILATEPSVTKWPSTIDGIAASGLRETIAPALSVRALLPLAEVRTDRAVFRLVDGEQKTVIMASVDASRLAGSGGMTLPTRISLTAIRGYDRELQRAAGLLTAAEGVDDADVSVREAALAAAGVPEYRGKPDPVLDGSAPAPVSIAAILLGWLGVIESNLSGAVADLDSEFLHDVRIAVRQTRTVLKATRDALPADIAERFTEQWRWLGGLTAPTRDLDVVLLGLAGRSDAFDVSGLDGLQPLADHLNKLRRKEVRTLRNGLSSTRLRTLLDDWREVIGEVAETTAGESTRKVALDRVRRAHRRVVKRAPAISADSDAEALHDLRKRCKELRYLLDAFAPLFDDDIRNRMIKDLKRAQDELGETQDGHVHRGMLTAFASTTPSPPTETVLAVGALIDRLDARQHHARTELVAALRPVIDAKNVTRLTRSASR